MALLQNLDTDRICRVCLQDKPELFLIFDQVYAVDGITLSQMLSECTRYKVERYDELPHQICNECMVDARNAYKFKRQTESAYCTLLGLLDAETLKRHKSKFKSIDNWTQTEKVTIHPCAECDEKFFDVFELKSHRLTKHREQLRTCKVCGILFPKMRQLTAHIAKEHPLSECSGAAQCPVCKKHFSRKEHMRRHLRTVHNNENWCSIAAPTPTIEPANAAKIEQEESNEALPSTDNKYTYWLDSSKDVFAEDVVTEDELELDFAQLGATNPISSDDEDSKMKVNMQAMHKTCAICLQVFSRRDHMKRHMRTIHKVHGDSQEPKQESTGVHSVDCSVELQSANLNLPKDDTNADAIETNATTTLSAVKAESIPKIKVEPVDWRSSTTIPEHDFQTEYETDFNTDNDDYAPHNDIADENDFSAADKLKLEIDAPTITPIKHIKSEKVTYQPRAAGKLTKKRRRKGDLKTEGPNELNQCNECQRVFSRHCHLRRHMLKHRGEKPHACAHCDKRFSRSDHLKKHIENVHNVKEFKCDQCDCAFVRKDALLRHQELKHCEDPSIYKVHACELCNKKFASKTYLTKHVLLHSARKYDCKICNVTYSERKLLREHEKTHSGERNFLCSICGEKFLRNDYLTVHMRRHTGEKPYKCQYCNKGFPRATDVKMHERYHTGTKPNLCNLCGKGFHRAYNLTIHMRTHTGERPFKCDQCPKGFSQSNDLKAHKRRHTGERFKCTDCDASFLQLYGLRQHALSAHGIHIDSNTGRLQKFVQRIEDNPPPQLHPVPAPSITAATLSPAIVPIKESTTVLISSPQPHNAVSVLEHTSTIGLPQSNHALPVIHMSASTPTMQSDLIHSLQHANIIPNNLQ